MTPKISTLDIKWNYIIKKCNESYEKEILRKFKRHQYQTFWIRRKHKINHRLESVTWEEKNNVIQQRLEQHYITKITRGKLVNLEFYTHWNVSLT